MPVLSGQVIAGDTGKGVDGVRVIIAASPTPMPDVALLTYGDGHFDLDLPVAGRYELEFVHDDYVKVSDVIDVGEETQSRVVTLPVAAGDSRSGR